MKKAILLIIGIIFIGIIILFFVWQISIQQSFEVKEKKLLGVVTISRGLWVHKDSSEKPYRYYFDYDCVEPTALLKLRCSIKGGEIRSEITAVGFGTEYTLGCYPVAKTEDAGRSCSDDKDCQGRCLWLAGDMITKDSHSTCSSFQEPFFTEPEDYAKSSSRTCNEVRNSTSIDLEFKNPGYEKEIESEYRKIVPEIIEEYWLNGKTDGMIDKLLDIIAPKKYNEIHRTIIQGLSRVERNEYSEIVTKEKVLNNFNELKLKYPWLVKK
jgi:hypothetical protein